MKIGGTSVEITPVDGKEHKGIPARTGNLYAATPADDTKEADPLVAGLKSENYLSPFEWINAEPAETPLD